MGGDFSSLGGGEDEEGRRRRGGGRLEGIIKGEMVAAYLHVTSSSSSSIEEALAARLPSCSAPARAGKITSPPESGGLRQHATALPPAHALQRNLWGLKFYDILHTLAFLTKKEGGRQSDNLCLSLSLIIFHGHRGQGGFTDLSPHLLYIFSYISHVCVLTM